MTLKTKLISTISAFVLILTIVIVAVWAASTANVTLGGTINFQATNVYAEITGTISGQENGPTTLPKLEFSNNQTPDTSGWAKGDLVFDPNASPIQIKIEINVKNLSGERSLFVKVDDLIGAVTNLTKSVMVGAEDKEGAYVEVLPLQSVDYVISLSPTDEGESVTGEYNYLITLIDESETQDIEIQANPNMETLGSVSGGGTFDLGDTVTLTATRSGSTFLAWATSLDPNTMEILSTSTSYSFELTEDSPTTYYALFNSTTSIRQTVEYLIYTFYNEAKLASVTDTTSTSLSGAFEIPSVVSGGENSYKVYSIGDNAFNSCSSLTSITIPEGVTSIGDSAFSSCSSLTSISLPSTLTSIGNSAFSYCSRLTSITLPSTLTSIEVAAFSGCSSLEAFYGNGNSYYTINDNRALIVDGGKKFLAYAAANPATSYSIPEGVTSIGDSAFRDCSSLTSISFPSTLTSIGGSTFYSCSGLTEITIPEGVTSIGGAAFFYCSGLTEITIPEGVTSIGDSAFRGCSSLTSVRLPSTLTSIGLRYTFYGCSSLTEIIIPEGVTSIDDYAFRDCSSLTSISLPSTLTSIEKEAFRGCSSLTTVEIPDSVTSIGAGAFRDCSRLTSISLPSTLTSIGDSAFRGCSSLASITIPEGVTSIGGFYGCSGLTEITINGNISTLGSGAFQSCTKLTKLTLGANVTSIPSNLFSTNMLTRLTEIVVEEGSSLSAALPTYAEWYKDDDPTAVTNFSGAGTYSTTQPTTITVEATQASLGSVSGGGEFDLGDTVTLEATASGSNTFLAWATSLDPNTMEILSTSTTYSFELTMDSPRTYYALFNQTTSTSQTVGNLIYTFYNEAKLASVTDTTSTSLSGAFEIPSVVPSGENSYKVYSIGNYAFQSCNRLTSITIPEGVTSIGDNAFFECRSLTSITIPEGVTSIGSSAFLGCGRLTSITLPSTLTSIGTSAFFVCSSLEAFYGNGNSYYTINDNRALIVDGGETLIAYAIGNSAASYSIPEGVTSIGANAFYYCSGLTSITLPSTLTSIGSQAFFNCSGLTSITLPSKLTSIGNNAFASCSGLTSITILEGVTSIGNYAFANCSSLTEITINGNISTLGSGAFLHCTNLTKLTLGANVTSIPSNLFTNSNLTNLTEIVVLGDLNSTTFPTGTWVKDGVSETVTNFSGAGTYTRTDI